MNLRTNESLGDVTVYGGGGNYPLFAESLAASGARTTLIVDQFSDKAEIDGVPVVRLGDERLDKTLPVYVCVSAISTGIARQLRELGFEDVRDFNDGVRTLPALMEKFLPAAPWYESGEELVDESEFDALSERLADDVSRDVLRRIRDFRRHLDAEHYLESDGQLQYFPDDVPLFDGLDEIRFVDCGAFTGDTLDVLLAYGESRGLPVRSVCLLEPEKRNLAALDERVVAHSSPSRHIVTIPCGAWSEDAVLRISSAGSSSRIVAPEEGSRERGSDGAHDVAVVQLDHAVRGMCPNYIKMDIEGAEREALTGGASVIRAHRPVLAICLYHRFDDLWEIPKLIDRICPGYAFHLRSHGDMGLETVLYALPSRDTGASAGANVSA